MKITIHTSDAGRAIIIADDAFALVLTRAQAEDLFDKLGAWVEGLTDDEIEVLLRKDEA